MRDSFEHFLFQKLQVNRKDKFLLAVSGGMDSMCLWNLFRSSGLNYIITHCNFKLRGKASDADETFVKEYALITEKVFTTSFDTKVYAGEKSLSTQMAARELRYTFFEEVRLKNECDYIVTAHHLDDQVETFFIQLLRRASVPALAGMPLRKEHILRPLMFTGREGIEEYVRKQDIPYREDESNDSDIYLRNRVRRNLIPALQKILPDFKLSVLELMGNLKEVTESMKEYFERNKPEIVRNENEDMIIDIEKLKDMEFPAMFLSYLLKPLGFNESSSRKVFDSIDAVSGKHFYSKNFRIVKDRHSFIISPVSYDSEIEISFTKDELISMEDFFIKAVVADMDMKLLKKSNPDLAMLDFEKVGTQITFRKWRNGDIFFPLGLGGKKKLSDYFIDNKYSLADKERQWLMCSDGEICWIVGKSIDDRFKIRENTKLMLILERL